MLARMSVSPPVDLAIFVNKLFSVSLILSFIFRLRNERYFLLLIVKLTEKLIEPIDIELPKILIPYCLNENYPPILLRDSLPLQCSHFQLFQNGIRVHIRATCDTIQGDYENPMKRKLKIFNI